MTNTSDYAEVGDDESCIPRSRMDFGRVLAEALWMEQYLDLWRQEQQRLAQDRLEREKRQQAGLTEATASQSAPPMTPRSREELRAEARALARALWPSIVSGTDVYHRWEQEFHDRMRRLLSLDEWRIPDLLWQGFLYRERATGMLWVNAQAIREALRILRQYDPTGYKAFRAPPSVKI